MSEKVSRWWWYCRWIGSSLRYFKESFIQPMFHFSPKPEPARARSAW